jgi:transcriptional regulator with XRE-family HTH domain
MLRRGSEQRSPEAYIMSERMRKPKRGSGENQEALPASIAERLRAYRIGLGLTVRELAARSGVSPSMVSEAERGAKTPSIAVLIALAEALGISLTQLIEKGSSRGPIHLLARADHRVLVDPSGVRREHLGSRVTGSHLEFVRFVLPPGTETGPLSGHQTGTIEHAHIAEGTIEVRICDERIHAETAASIVFPADQVHGYANRGTEEATIYVVSEPLIVRNGRNATAPSDSHV